MQDYLPSMIAAIPARHSCEHDEASDAGTLLASGLAKASTASCARSMRAATLLRRLPEGPAT